MTNCIFYIFYIYTLFSYCITTKIIKFSRRT